MNVLGYLKKKKNLIDIFKKNILYNYSLVKFVIKVLIEKKV